MRVFNQNAYFSQLKRLVTPESRLLFGKQILITGANGLIGGSLLDFFLYLNKEYQAGITLYALVRSQLEVHDFFKEEAIRVLQQSVTEPIAIEGDLDFIFHAASNAHPKAYHDYPVETIMTTVSGTQATLELARQKSAKLIFISSSEVYGEMPAGQEQHLENHYGVVDILEPRSCYSESKRLAETLLASYVKQYGVQAVVARPAYIFGARFSESNTRADVEFIKKCISGQNIVMKSEGLQQRSYCYVLDCVSALLAIALFGEDGQAYNISSSLGNVRLREFAASLAKTAGVELIFDLAPTQGGSMVVNSLLSNQRLKQLGWVEQFSLDDGVKATLDCVTQS